MIIGDLYQTKIECVKGDTTTPYYNVDIDATDVTVIVSLIDFNGVPVTGKSVTLSVDRGLITGVKSGYTGTVETGGKSVTGTTGSDGKLKVTYTASEWGLCTFSTNNITVQVNVTGLKLIKSSSSSDFGGDYKLFVDEANHTAVAELEINNKNIGIGATNYSFNAFIPEKYRPKSSLYSFGDRYLDVIFYIFSSGTVGVSNIKGSTQSGVSVACSMTWSYQYKLQ